MAKKILSFDIETIPDIETSRVLLNLDNSISEDVVHQNIVDYHIQNSSTNNDFLKQCFHKIVCTSYVLAEFDKEINCYNVKNIKSVGDLNFSELEIVSAFNDYCKKTYLNKDNLKLVTFNGKMFDIQVFKTRAMKYGIQMGWFYNSQDDSRFRNQNSYDYRYSQDNIDLMEFFSGYRNNIKMAEICACFDIPCKYSIDGGDVYGLYKEKKLKQIRDYCEIDALITYILYVIYDFHCGNLNLEQYKNSFKNLFEYIKKLNNNHLNEFIERAKNSNTLKEFL